MANPEIVINDGDEVTNVLSPDTAKTESASTFNEHYADEAQAFLTEHATCNNYESVYGLNPTQLGGLIDPKDAYMLEVIGGPDKLAYILNTNQGTGLTSEQLSDKEVKERTRIYGKNVLPVKKSRSLVKIMWQTLDDKVLIILIVAAIISLALGLYETFGEPTEYDDEGRALPKVDWVEGVAILVAVIIVTVVGSLNDWQKERQFVKLNRKKEERLIQVLRNGGDVQIPIEEILVGDLVSVQPGDVLAVDGVLIRGSDVKCDESSVTGESDTLRKHPASIALQRLEGAQHTAHPFSPHDKKVDCMMLSGSKVLEGTGLYMVTAVGPNSMFGKTMMSLRDDGVEITPLQEKLNRIADGIAKFGLGAAVVLFTVLFIRFLIEITNGYASDWKSYQKGSRFMDIFIVSVTIIVVAVPEGLPLAVTLALAFATSRMIKEKNLVRVLKSCETMGGATTICSDKTGTLTQNKMTVVALTVGDRQFDQDELEEHAHQDSVPKELLLETIFVNCSVFEEHDDPQLIVGSKTEAALVAFCRSYFGIRAGGLREYREAHPVLRTVPFDSSRKYMLSIISLGNNRYRYLIKGAAEVILRSSNTYWTPGGTVLMDQYRDFIDSQVSRYANQALRPIVVAFKDFETTLDILSLDLSDLNTLDLTFVALFGIQDPLRPGVKEAVAQCTRAGVVVRMVTGDNVATARAIALNARIITNPETDIVMEGPNFRKLDEDALVDVVPRLRVLARSSPQDKRKLVAFLKNHGETVAVTGDGTNDAPALRLADVGFSMGITGTEVAKEASDIIIMDDNFTSIVNAIKWGRTVNDAVKKFLQFQLTVNITAVTLTFVSAVASKDNKSVLTAVQLLWVNLIMDTLAALALATDAPTDAVLDRLPDNRSKSLITVTMWKMIIGQSIFQLCVTLILHFAAPTIWGIAGVPHDSRKDTELAAMVFNTFVWMQFFKLWVSRRVDNQQNIFAGLSKNPFFPVIVLIVGGFQVLIMFVGGAAFTVRPQTGAEWGVALIAGALSIPIGCVIRLIPDSWVVRIYPALLVNTILRLLDGLMSGLAWIFSPITWVLDKLLGGLKFLFLSFIHLFKRNHSDEPVPEASSKASPHYEWNEGIQKSIDELSFMRKFRGGRLHYFRSLRRTMPWSKQDNLSPSVQLGRHSSTGNLSGTTVSALMAPIVVGGAVGGWSPKPIYD